jgi:16S rRNA G966 N2-methylase RsmD
MPSIRRYEKLHKRNKKKYIEQAKSMISKFDYPLLRFFRTLTRSQFYDYVREFKPVILNEIPPELEPFGLKTYKNTYCIIKENWAKNEDLNNCTDFFTEDCRVHCRFSKHISPIEYWEKNKTKILNSVTKLTSKAIRDKIYYGAKLCNNFRISVALTILDIFKPKKWLDISAGWGDRLMAAIGYGMDLYFGVDPNPCVHQGYKEMINELVNESKRSNYVLVQDGFEDVTLPKNVRFDLVFSSPPFFDLEVYSSSEKDSLVRNQSSDSWYENFLLVSLKKAFNHLIFGGYMVIYMDEAVGTNYVQRMILDVNEFPNCAYHGIIYYYYPGNGTRGPSQPRSMYVWQKV